MWLTEDERRKFAAYLEEGARSAEGLLKQMEVLKSPATEPIYKKLKLEAAAQRIVAAKLRGMESQEL